MVFSLVHEAFFLSFKKLGMQMELNSPNLLATTRDAPSIRHAISSHIQHPASKSISLSSPHPS